MPYQETALPQPAPMQQSAPATQKKRRFLRVEKIGPAFWTVASLLSMTVNVILIVVLVLLGRQLFAIKNLLQGEVLGKLSTNFQAMDDAHIRTTIPVSAQVPAKFDLPLSTNTTVTLTEDTTLPNATIYELNAGALYISRAKTNIILPAGTKLPVALNLTVPVDQQIPVNLMVNVDIPLNQTDLHQPFTGLKGVVEPIINIMSPLPNTWQETICGPNPTDTCRKFVP